MRRTRSGKTCGGGVGRRAGGGAGCDITVFGKTQILCALLY